MIKLDGKKLQNEKFKIFKKRVEKLSYPPHLVVIQIGNNSSSNIYITKKENAAKKLGINFTKIHFEKNISYEKLKKEIIILNNDNKIHGIFVQFPLPKHISKRKVAILINPKKDVDGIHPLNQGLGFTSANVFFTKPCTPSGVMELLKKYKINLSGKFVVIIGRSQIVGKPMFNMLLNANSTVSIIHSYTNLNNKKLLLKNADIIISATGQKNIFEPCDVKKNVVIIDIGIIRKSDGKICGDINYKKFGNVASYITPVPGGVGPMTVTMLMENIISIVENNI